MTISRKITQDSTMSKDLFIGREKELQDLKELLHKKAVFPSSEGREARIPTQMLAHFCVTKQIGAR